MIPREATPVSVIRPKPVRSRSSKIGSGRLEDLQSISKELNILIESERWRQESGAGSFDRNMIKALAKKVISTVQQPEEQWVEQAALMSEVCVIRVFNDWKAFDMIPQEGSISIKAWAEKLNAQEELIVRMSRILVATGTLQQVKDDGIMHTPLSKIYTNRHPAGLYFNTKFDIALVPGVGWVEYFEKFGRRVPEGITHTPFSIANNEPDKSSFEIIGMDQQRVADFAQSMNIAMKSKAVTGFYNFDWIAEKGRKDKDRTLLVDVGGGSGGAVEAITKAHSGIDRARCIVQDLNEVVESAHETMSMEMRQVHMMAHSFWEQQPVKGAICYFLRRIMHDYPDSKCTEILGHLVNAMAPDSRLLISDELLTRPPTLLGAQTDLSMLNIGGKERTKEDWLVLASKSGLRVSGIFTSKENSMCVIECTKA
ncbi:S-adenosyl-L-methionine-dependent methyltransferase [Microthyrium microscopicum]|uniref:S-adenosyl-L-methionine-dependent methyltransferase n=1 Tax=Microthyrium microscopicum TaxID=703497 RepID=A0A6A6U1F9_9PEZI|nr:S-adenosyl-L-methionine-dependent methyltransferase [Microthyrium microscopicum]